MFKQRKLYDFFIYSEDDILFTKKNFYYWLKYKDLCIKNDYNLVRETLLNPKLGFNALTGSMGKYIQPRTKGAGHGSTSRAFYARPLFLQQFIKLY